MSERKYGLVTAITMVIGIVIGSGIFFKTDDILIKTNGNVLTGVIALIVGAIGIIFGGLTIAQIANRDDKAGGIITYSERSYGRKFGYYVGISQILLYYPCLAAIISWVAGIYTGILFGFEVNSIVHWIISLLYILVLFVINLITERLGGFVQNFSTFIKIIPLVLIAILGIIFGNIDTNTIQFSGSNIVTSMGVIVAVAFAYDGWILTTSICHEVKNAKRNIPLALIIGPIIVLVIYVLYYIGICNTIGVDEIINLGDSHVAKVANVLLGVNAYKYIIICIVISVLGTVNGLILALIRLPYSMGIRDELPKSNFLSKINEKTKMPINSGIVSIIPVSFWYLFHYLTTKINVISTFDISALPIIFNYIIYIALYIYVIKLTIKGEIRGVLRGYVIPIIAIIGALIVIYGGFTDKNIYAYIITTIIILIIGMILRKVRK